MVKVLVAAGVLAAVVTVSTEVPDAPITVGLNDPDAPAGSPLTLSVTSPAKELMPETVALYVVLAPCVMLRDDGLAETLKSAVPPPPPPLAGTIWIALRGARLLPL